MQAIRIGGVAMSLPNQVRKLEHEVVDRLKALEPLIFEYDQLRKVAERLGVKYTPTAAEAAGGGGAGAPPGTRPPRRPRAGGGAGDTQGHARPGAGAGGGEGRGEAARQAIDDGAPVDGRYRDGREHPGAGLTREALRYARGAHGRPGRNGPAA